MLEGHKKRWQTSFSERSWTPRAMLSKIWNLLLKVKFLISSYDKKLGQANQYQLKSSWIQIIPFFSEIFAKFFITYSLLISFCKSYYRSRIFYYWACFQRDLPYSLPLMTRISLRGIVTLRKNLKFLYSLVQNLAGLQVVQNFGFFLIVFLIELSFVDQSFIITLKSYELQLQQKRHQRNSQRPQFSFLCGHLFRTVQIQTGLKTNALQIRHSHSDINS